MSHIRGASRADNGGGYEAHLACHRAIQEAFSGLFFTCDVTASPVPFTSMETDEV